MQRVEVFSNSSLICDTVNPTSPDTVSVPINRTIAVSGARRVSCPLLVEGACAAVAKTVPCKQLSPGEYYFPDMPNRPQPNPSRIITLRQAEVLNLQTHLSDKQIARRLHIGYRTVGGHIEGVYKRLGVDNEISAVLLATALGITPLDEAVAELDPELINTISPRRRHILQTIIDSLGTLSSAADLAQHFGNSVRTIEYHLNTVRQEFNAHTLTHATVLFLAARSQEYFFASPPKGRPQYKDVAHGIADTRRAAIRRLTPQETAIMDVIVDSLGEISSREELAEYFGFSQHAIQKHLRSIKEKTGTLTIANAALLYFQYGQSPNSPQ